MSCHHYPVLTQPPLPGAAPHRRPYRLRRHDDPRRDRRRGRARGAPARRQLGGRDAARGRVRRQPRRHDGALDQRALGVDAASRRQPAARRGAEPAAFDRHVRASQLRPAHRVRADLPRAGREHRATRRSPRASTSSARSSAATKPRDGVMASGGRARASAVPAPATRRARGTAARPRPAAWPRPSARRCTGCR